MDALREINPWLVGCAALAVLLFATREVAAGLLRAIGGDLWRWVRRRWTRQGRAGSH